MDLIQGFVVVAIKACGNLIGSSLRISPSR